MHFPLATPGQPVDGAWKASSSRPVDQQVDSKAGVEVQDVYTSQAMDGSPSYSAASLQSLSPRGAAVCRATGLDLSPLRDGWLKYDVALVLKDGPGVVHGDVRLSCRDIQAQIVEMLHRASLDIAFLRCTDKRDDARRVVLLVNSSSCTKAGRTGTLLEREYRKQFVERFLAEGHHGAVTPPQVCSVVLACPTLPSPFRLWLLPWMPPQIKESSLTAAKKVEMTYRVVRRAIGAVTKYMNKGATNDLAALCVGKHEGDLVSFGRPSRTADEYIEACFPLHDSEWSAHFVGLYMSTIINWRRWGAVARSLVDRVRCCKRKARPSTSTVTPGHPPTLAWDSSSNNITGVRGSRFWVAAPTTRWFTGSSLCAEQVRDEPLSGERSDSYAPEDWVVQELRHHLGERVAFYLAFLNFYTSMLIPVGTRGLCGGHGSRSSHAPCAAAACHCDGGFLFHHAVRTLGDVHAWLVRGRLSGASSVGPACATVLAAAPSAAAPRLGVGTCTTRRAREPESLVPPPHCGCSEEGNGAGVRPVQ